MKFNQMYPSKYMVATDFPQPVVGVMNHVSMEEMGDKKMKAVLYFANLPKGVVLNKTNGYVISQIYGDESDSWSGQQIELYQDQTSFQGEIKPCIRVRAVTPAQIPAQQAAQPAQGVYQTPVTNTPLNTPPGLEPNVPPADTFPGNR